MDGIDVVGIVWMAFNYFIFCPLLIRYAHQFYRIEPDDPIKRYRSTVMCCSQTMIMLFTLCIERLYAQMVVVWRIFPINWVYYLFFSCSWWSAFFLFVVKVFYLYYKQKYSMAIAELAWKSQLDPNEHNNWFIVHKNTYGNPVHCMKILLFPFLGFVVLNTVISYIFGESLVLDFTQYTIASIPILAAFIIFYKSKDIRDVFKIRNEILYQCIIIFSALTFYLAVFLFFKLAPKWNMDDSGNGLRIEWLCRNLVANLCAVGLALLPAAYPVHLHALHSDETELQRLHEQSPSPKEDTVTSRSTLEENCNASMAALKQVLSNSESFKMFMQHLISEFSTESLLYLVEYIQVRHEHAATGRCNEIGVDLYEEHGKHWGYVSIPSDIPQSAILKQGNDLRQQLTMVYHKYIKPNSQAEINISAKCREKSISILDIDFIETPSTPDTDEELIHAMDAAAIEILMLLQDPFSRFKSDACN